MNLVLVAIVVIVLLGLVVIGLVTWLLLRPRTAPVAQPHAHGAPAEGYPSQPPYPGQPTYPAQPAYPVEAGAVPVDRYAPQQTPPTPPVPPAPAPAQQFAPPHAQTWTAEVTEPWAEQADDSELDETTRLREDLRPAPPVSPVAPPAPPTSPAPPA